MAKLIRCPKSVIRASTRSISVSLFFLFHIHHFAHKSLSLVLKMGKVRHPSKSLLHFPLSYTHYFSEKAYKHLLTRLLFSQFELGKCLESVSNILSENCFFQTHCLGSVAFCIFNLLLLRGNTRSQNWKQSDFENIIISPRSYVTPAN